MASSKTPMNGTQNNNKTADVHDSASSDVLPNSTLLNKDPQQAENAGLANAEMHQPVVKDTLFIALLKQLWRSFKFYTRIIIYIPLLILVLLALILGTSIGSNIGITIASQLIPNLELNYQSGTINHDLKLDYASWEMDGISVEINDLAIEWLPRCFINKQLCVDSLSASKVTVDIQTALLSDTATSTLVDSQIIYPELMTSAQSNTTEQNLSTADNAAKHAPAEAELSDSDLSKLQSSEQELLILPFDISLNNADLAAINVTVNDMHFNASQLKAKAFWTGPDLKVEHISSFELAVIIPNEDETQTSTADSAEKAWPLADLPAVYLPFRLFIKELNSLDSTLQIGQRKDFFEQIIIAGNYIGYNIGLSQLHAKHSYGDLDLIGDINLVDSYPMNIKVSANIDQIAELPGFTKQKLTLELTDDLKKLAINAKLTGDTTLNLQADVGLNLASLPFRGEISDSKIQWPFKDPQYIANIQSLQAQGKIDAIQAQLLGQFISPFHPELKVDSNLAFQQNTLKLSPLTIQSKAGQLQIEGEVDLADNITWQTKVSTQDLSLQNIEWLQQFTPLRSKISGQFVTSGKMANDKWQIDISDASLKGRMNGYPVTLEGQVAVNQDFAVNAQNLKATALGADLFINGRADSIWNIDAELNVPDLRQWLDGSRGNIHAKVTVTGASDNPMVDLTAKMQNSSFAGAKLDNLTLNAHYLPFNQHQYSFALDNQNIVYKGYKLTSLNIEGKGDQSQQTTTLVTTGDTTINSELLSQTNIDNQTIDATLKQLNISNIFGKWQLDEPIVLAWDQLKNRGKIDAFCISHPHNKLCLTNKVELGAKGQADINFSGNPGQLLAPILSKNINWDGHAALTSQINWQPKTKPTAVVNFTLLPGNIKLIRNVKNVVNIDYQELVFKATLDEKQLRTTITADSDGIASLQTEMNINVTPDRALDGFINIQSLNLEPFGEFFPRLQTLNGNLSTRMNLSGSLMTPDITGNIKLSDGAFALTSNPTLVEKIFLGLQLNGQQAELDGQWHMGDGQAIVNGQLYWPDGQFSGDINVKGTKLAVIQPPIAILDVSPDLNIKFNHQQVAVKGAVSVPSGQIKIMQLSAGGVALSNDVVFNDSISELEVQTSPYAIVADINIDVGKELSIDGMGLTGKLSGNLRLQQQAFKPPLLFGDIKVNKGNYKFMGQTLKINAGEVQFVGPVEVPNLNIEAIKEIKDEDITAGIRVTGTAMRPNVILFSNPAKEQAEVLSYILTGKGFGNASDQQNNSLMMGAALSLGSQVDGGAMTNIGSTARGVIEQFGFSNVQLDANDDGRVAISGYIGDSLMIKYGIGVFNPGYEMTVRYYLLSQLYLETVSGSLSQSLDIYYGFDID
ncbi:translocation/assembly module TamB domain-containing protein [Shewanella subflava]|uniref:Translocation/assembly module TamB domain-containing protein n=1 Tax=Shewanella subflava TaxID=2986476 RepID=A0ABT3IDU2_9GAMM|nr:translocation/assembly module TamB domain-containing protein [Shewanella subflava]MCW3174229.1 translocation/assembly module TamB domain-containing protein [Shewanella subflava]